jgi:hypothetical protein
MVNGNQSADLYPLFQTPFSQVPDLKIPFPNFNPTSEPSDDRV